MMVCLTIYSIGSLPNTFDNYKDTAWNSMLTYEPLKREKISSAEEVRKHDAAKWIRLSRIALEMGKIQTAREAVSTGLNADPNNSELLQLKVDLDKK